MGDLTIGTAVVGLTQTAIRIAHFLSGVVDAPFAVRSLLAEVRAMTIVFRCLNTFITDSKNRRHANASSDILVDDLVIVVTCSLCTYSELEALLQGSLSRSCSPCPWARQAT
jgi:hypothetical protein